MKRIFGLGVLVLGMSAGVSAKEATFKVNPEKSQLNWLGKKVTGKHWGTVNLANGSLVFNGANLVGGEFVIDMNSITVSKEDLADAETNAKLVGHLKNDDFFGVDKGNKTATLKITSAKPLTGNPNATHEVSGDLTIKGKTNKVTFPAKIDMKSNQVMAEAKIVVDRTKWDIRYGSATFFEKLGDKAINNDFEMDVKLAASK